MMRLQANCASTWVNHNSGSAGQKGGSLRLTVSVETPAAVPEVPPEVVEAEGSMANDCRGHQCSVGELPNILI